MLQLGHALNVVIISDLGPPRRGHRSSQVQSEDPAGEGCEVRAQFGAAAPALRSLGAAKQSTDDELRESVTMDVFNNKG